MSGDRASPSDVDLCTPEFGLTKREYFAALAMQGQMANEEILVRYGLYAADIARSAVAQADALIAALNAEVQPSIQ